MITANRFILASFLAWIVFIGIDFLFHASILASLWDDALPALKPKQDLALLIPAGYLSFLLLTVLTGWLFRRLFRNTEPSEKAVWTFALVFATLFSGSYFMAQYSILNLPATHIAAFSLVYFIEIVAITWIYHFVFLTDRPKNLAWKLVLVFVGLVVVGVVVQNL